LTQVKGGCSKYTLEDVGLPMSKRPSCAICAVRRGALCGTLEVEQLPRLNRVTFQKQYCAGQFIAGAGQREDWFATILSGVVKLIKTMSDGRQQIVSLLFASDFLGRPFGRAGRYRVEAATSVKLCCVERQYFEDLLQQSPDMKHLLLERTLNEVDAAREWMLLLGRKTAEEKVSSLILMMAQRMLSLSPGAPAPPQILRFELPLSRTEMAEYLGLRIETVSRQIRRLRAADVIATDNGRMLLVHDLEKLTRLAGNDRV
jgi:CRP/FNR family transcriptional regulator, anaerobic regulatory protein